jgi:hypothetical protein
MCKTYWKSVIGDHEKDHLWDDQNQEGVNPSSLQRAFFIVLSGIAQLYSPGLWAGWSGVQVPRRAEIFLFTTMSRLALGSAQPPIQWVLGALSLGVKWPGYEADHSPPSSAKVKEHMELYLHSLKMPS